MQIESANRVTRKQRIPDENNGSARSVRVFHDDSQILPESAVVDDSRRFVYLMARIYELTSQHFYFLRGSVGISDSGFFLHCYTGIRVTFSFGSTLF
jgi:hypothetical protein